MIGKVKWKDYKVIKGLELDFYDKTGIPYNTIVIAGENGTGKTTVLSSIASFLYADREGVYSFEPFEYIESYLHGDKFLLTIVENGDIKEGHHKRTNISTGESRDILGNCNGVFFSNGPDPKEDVDDIRKYGCIYSKAEADYKTRQIDSATRTRIDDFKLGNLDQLNDDYTFIKQLLIDIFFQDSAELNGIFEKNHSITEEEGKVFSENSRLERFKKAFNNFFDNSLQFIKIDAQSLEIIFEKNGNEVIIDNLSTGEKQIVFRGAYLLRNCRQLSEGIILIDEPELSLHPKWQKRIFDYYHDLFTENTGKCPQIIIATHSEYVVSSALKRANTLVIALNDNNGVVTPQKVDSPSVLPTITSAETNYLAFGIASIDYHIQLYGFLQEKIRIQKHLKTCSVKECDNNIVNSSCYDASNHSKTYINGSTTYQSLPTYIRNCIDHPDSLRSYTEKEMEISIELLRNLCI